MENKISDFKKDRLVLLICIILFFLVPLLGVVFFGENIFSKPLSLFFVILIVFISAKRTLLVDSFKCPNCAKDFIGRAFKKNPFRQKCYHCNFKI